jgi:hypothetical protein
MVRSSGLLNLKLESAMGAAPRGHLNSDVGPLFGE